MFHIKGRLQEERAAAETRRQKMQERDLRFILESRVSESEAKAHRLEGLLEMAHERLLSQEAESQQLTRKLEAELDQSRTQLSEADARAQKLQEILMQEERQAVARASRLEQELATIRQTLWQEKKAAGALDHQLKAERDKHRTQLSGFENRLQNIEEQPALAQKQFRDQRAAVTLMIKKRAADGEESQ